MIKRVICFVFVVVLVLSLVGCAYSTDDGDNTAILSEIENDEDRNDESEIDGLVIQVDDGTDDIRYESIPHGTLGACVYHMTRSGSSCDWEKTEKSYKWNGFKEDLAVYFEKCSLSGCNTKHTILVNGETLSIEPGKYYILRQVRDIEVYFDDKYYPRLKLFYPIFGEKCLDEEHLEAYKYYYQGEKPVMAEVYVGNGLYTKEERCGRCHEEVENYKYKYCPYCGSKIILGD